MNNENQETKEQQTGNFWQDKMLPWLKALWADKIKCLYILALSLQLLFLLMQFMPIMNVVTSAKTSFLGGLQIKKEKFSIMGLCKEVPGLIVLFIFDLILFGLSLKSTLTYFISKYDKMKSGFGLAKVATIFILIFFGIIVAVGSTVAEVADNLEEMLVANGDKIFSLTFGGHLYWLIGLALLIVFFVLSVKVKEKKQEDKVNALVAEELQKKNEQGNMQ